MAVEATITGNGAYAGSSSALADYSATEDATPLRPGSNTGGVGQLTFSVIEDPDSRNGTLSLMGDVVRLADGSNGVTAGNVTGVAITDGLANITADSRLGLLVATRTAQPRQDTPGNIFRYYLSLAGVTTGIVVEDGFDTAAAVAVQGWTGVVWDNIRQFAVSNNAEVALVSENVVFRRLRKREAVNTRNITEQISVRKGQLAQNIEINYYNNQYRTGQAYPEGGVWTDEVQVYQVDVSEVLEINVPISASLVSVTQPNCVSFVGRYDAGSVYSVIGADGLPIPPAQWLGNGGSVVVKIGEDTRSLDITITGANTTQGPYRIAVASSASDTYSSLRVTGLGTFFTKQTLTIPTGASADETAQLVGITVDNINISTLEQAYTFGVREAAAYGGYEQTISVSTVGINRNDVTGSAAYPTFNQFNAGNLNWNGETTPSWVDKTFSDFSAVWSGKTFDQFNAYYFDFVRNTFNNQAFGNVSGARVRLRDSYYRIDSATIKPTQVDYVGTQDTVFNDFFNTWVLNAQDGNIAVLTFNDFEAKQSGRAFNDFNMTPLWRTSGKSA